ncbi:MAG TPA: NADAR family protein [Ktedonobacteraceae bacterium]
MTIYFYNTHERPYGVFSNFSAYGVDLDGLWWPTTEHYFQAQKFAGTPYAEQIRLVHTPRQAADLGRKHEMPLRPDWEEVKDAVMLKAVQRKFEMHPELRAILLATAEDKIVENAPGDYYWGCGADGTGKNMLGQTLMLVRTILRK